MFQIQFHNGQGISTGNLAFDAHNRFWQFIDLHGKRVTIPAESVMMVVETPKEEPEKPKIINIESVKNKTEE